MTILIFVQADFESGLGHLTRCLSLAQAFERVAGVTPKFVGVSDSFAGWLSQFGFQVCKEPLTRLNPELVIIDRGLSSGRDSIELASIYPRARLIVIHDNQPLAGQYDYVLNGSIYAHEIHYKTYPGCGFILGAKFQPMRDQFWNVKPRQPVKQLKKILIMLGGGHAGLGSVQELLELVPQLPDDLEFHLVVASTVGLMKVPSRVIVHESPISILPIMCGCDLAISGGGQVLYELAVTGTPAIAMPVATNQVPNIRHFEKSGFLESVEYGDEMSESGQAIVDGMGALRVANLMAEI
jgi:UDP-2,4-diacetamido-2,4,6-trideoxy-beta-L-altropyranose hydrolase